MNTTERHRGFSLYMAGASGLLCLVAGIVGSFAGVIPAILVAVAGAALLGRYGRAVLGFEGRKQKAYPVKSGEPAAAIPQDRIDELTGLANANGLAAWFSEKADRLSEDKKGIFVLLADLDKIEEIQRIRGKETAEAVIKEVAKRVAGFVGDEGIAARTGEDEFVAVAAVVPANAFQIAEESAGKLAETICRPVDLGGGTIWIGGAVGAAVGSPREGDAIMARAKAALEKARSLGLGRFWVDGTP
jgi:diguanylate cyclase (GGDEF)-like protein